MSRTESPPWQMLRTQWDRLEPFDLGRPPSMSVDEYLEFLSAHNLLDPQTADTTRSAYHQLRYGSNGVTPEPLNELLVHWERALAKIERMDESVRSELAAELRSRVPAAPWSTPPPAAKQADVPRPADPAQWMDDALDDEFSAEANVQKPSGIGAWSAAAGVAVWTAFVLVVSYVNHDRIELMLASKNDERADEAPAADDDSKIRYLQQLLSGMPSGRDKARHLNLLGTIHHGRGEYADAIVAYERAIEESPQDAWIRNNLAWLLLTSEHPLHRRPRRAFNLATEASRIDPAPEILDTLAEACFQTQRYREAVEWEERALAQNPRNRGHYQRQLAKFRAALEESTQTAAR